MLQRLLPLPMPLLALAIVLSDIGLLCLAQLFGAALVASARPSVASLAMAWPGLVLVLLCLIGCGAALPESLHRRGQMLVRVLAGLSLAAIVLAMGHLIWPSDAHLPGQQLIMLLLALPLLCGARLGLSHLADWRGFARRLFVLGTADGYARVAGIVAKRPGLVLLGHADPDGPYVAGQDGLAEHVHRLGVTEVILATTSRQHWPLRALVRSRMAGVRVTDLPHFIERETCQIDLRWMRPPPLVGMPDFGPQQTFAALLKRGLDVCLALALLVLSAPLLVLLMLAIRFETAGPALFWQERVGQFGQRFRLVKLRSMRTDAEADGQPRWAEEDDPRVTRLGRWLRQLHLDELPQLWNILRGEMSFVGPRPERPEFVRVLESEIPYYTERHLLRPGLTGWAQINYPYAASLADARAKLEYDLFYIKYAHPLLDIFILLQTARVLLWPSGAR